MADEIVQPKFNPEYVPAVIDGETKAPSIEIECLNADTNVFTYTAWDGQPRFFTLVRDSVIQYHDSMEVGQTFEMDAAGDWVVLYHVDQVYEYKVVNGQCQTTVPTTPTTEPPSSNPTLPPDTTLPIPSTTSTSMLSDAPSTTVATSTSSENGTGSLSIQMSTPCEWDSSVNQFRDVDGTFMSYSECSTGDLPETGISPVGTAGLAGIFLVLGTLVVMAGRRRKARKEAEGRANSLFTRPIPTSS